VKSVIDIGGMPCSNAHPMMLFGGMNVLESRELAFEIAEVCVDVCRKLQIPYVFKASFDKANRSSIASFRGPGLEKGLTWLSDIKSHFNVPLITDVHEPDQALALGTIILLSICSALAS
jgi:2-dehydro-3-deoxyphosphooctonate aldolase (KDO 8-P synthase)